MEMSRSPSPTTVKPMTEPAEKATLRPRFRLLWQAAAVRALALVAICMPTNPDRPEKNPYRLQGPTLEELSVMKASDRELFSGEESFLPVSFKPKSTPEQPLFSARSLLFTPEQFDRVLDFALEKAKEGVDGILAGHAEISPYRGDCAYCEFKGICRNYKVEHVRAPSGKKLFGEDGI